MSYNSRTPRWDSLVRGLLQVRRNHSNILAVFYIWSLRDQSADILITALSVIGIGAGFFSGFISDGKTYDTGLDYISTFFTFYYVEEALNLKIDNNYSIGSNISRI